MNFIRQSGSSFDGKVRVAQQKQPRQNPDQRADFAAPSGGHFHHRVRYQAKA